MATISVGAGNYLRPIRNYRLRQFPVDTSQTVDLGDILVLSTDANEGNRVKVAGADPATDRSLVGVAMEAITTTGTHVAATDKVLVALFTQDSEWLIHVEDTETIDNDAIGVEYGVVLDSTNNIWRLDQDETTAKVFRVLELPGALGNADRWGVHGDTNGAYIVAPIAPERLYGD